MKGFRQFGYKQKQQPNSTTHIIKISSHQRHTIIIIYKAITHFNSPPSKLRTHIKFKTNNNNNSSNNAGTPQSSCSPSAP